MGEIKPKIKMNLNRRRRRIENGDTSLQICSRIQKVKDTINEIHIDYYSTFLFVFRIPLK